MKVSPTQMSAQDLSVVLGISEETVIKLAETDQIPCFRLNNRIYFIFDEIMNSFKRLEGETA